MTPLAPHNRGEGEARFGPGFAIGVAIPLGVLILFIVGNVWYAKKKVADTKRGWNLVPVLVVSKPISPGMRIGRENVEPRTLPEQFVSASVVTPERFQEVLGHRARFGLGAGETLLFSSVEMDGSAWFATRDISAGAPFDAADFEERRIEAEAFTVWTVREGQFEQLKGTTYERAIRSGQQLRLSDVSPVQPSGGSPNADSRE